MEIACIESSNPLPDLFARFRIRRHLFRSEIVEAPVFRLSDDQCVFKTDRTLVPGDRLTVELILHLPFEDLVIPQLTGTVAKAKKYCSNFFCTLDFNTPHGGPLEESVPGVHRMTEILRRKLALEQRRVRGARGQGEAPAPAISQASNLFHK